MIRKGSEHPPLALVLLLFFFSGALALVYQVVWSRMMTHVFGSTALAVGTVLAAFMAGMAAGSWYGGRFADRFPDRLRLYAWLELGVGLTALGAHLALSHMDVVFPALHRWAGDSATGIALIRFISAFVLVMAPTSLMGATLPVLSRFVADLHGKVGTGLSLLYSVNTLGAVVGVLVTGFVLIGNFGIHIPVYSAVIANLVVGMAAWLVARRAAGPATWTPDMEERSPPAPDDGIGDRLTLNLVIAGLGLSGFTSFAYEIYWTRSLVFVLGNSTYALTTMLSAFLTGIALGSLAVRILIERFRDRVAVFGWVQVSLGIVSAMALPLLFAIDDPMAMNRTLHGLADRALSLVTHSFGVAFLVMLLPAALIGATFPLVGQLAVRRLTETGATVGRVYAVNTAGNVLGALLPGLVLLGWLGIQKGILAMAALNMVLGFAVLSVRLLRPPARSAWRVILPVLALLAFLLLGRTPLQFQFPALGERTRDQTLFYREGPLATTKVLLDPVTGDKEMSVDGIVIGGTGNTEFKQLLLAHLPRLLSDDTSEELSVGLGSGILVGESALHQDVRDVTAVEIEPGVVQGAAFFDEENHRILEDPRLTVVLDDIGNFLRTTDRKYQVISADEKTADEFASNGFSYSRDYYELLLAHLAPDGLVAQWVPATLPPRQYRMILRTFADVFPHVQLWYFLPAHRPGPFNSILIGSPAPVALNVRDLERRFSAQAEALDNLVPYGITSPEALLSHYVADERVIRAAVADAPLNTLDHPRYEFYHPWEYAAGKVEKVIENQAFIVRLKRLAYGDFFTTIAGDGEDADRLRQTFAAEFAYLEAFHRYLAGAPLPELSRMFDDALAAAPWNDSLRARIYVQYAYLASIQSDPVERERLMRRARALYETREDAATPRE